MCFFLSFFFICFHIVCWCCSLTPSLPFSGCNHHANSYVRMQIVLFRKPFFVCQISSILLASCSGQRVIQWKDCRKRLCVKWLFWVEDQWRTAKRYVQSNHTIEMDIQWNMDIFRGKVLWKHLVVEKLDQEKAFVSNECDRYVSIIAH